MKNLQKIISMEIMDNNQRHIRSVIVNKFRSPAHKAIIKVIDWNVNDKAYDFMSNPLDFNLSIGPTVYSALTKNISNTLRRD